MSNKKTKETYKIKGKTLEVKTIDDVVLKKPIVEVVEVAPVKPKLNDAEKETLRVLSFRKFSSLSAAEVVELTNLKDRI